MVFSLTLWVDNVDSLLLHPEESKNNKKRLQLVKLKLMNIN